MVLIHVFFKLPPHPSIALQISMPAMNSLAFVFGALGYG
ncbi:hypothetical protein YSA_04991 [Pseudomonas putida ND6]|uniref:Uncharacterized protein n=1 Tax=Pseudomonas putida ND6 TaxID=231023 RepID=I3UVE6_PSEPU|nr:hypothetical protein YSA_04991 [Pseudomonas putida ND6]